MGERATADYFEAGIDGQSFPAKFAANWIIGELSGRLNKENCAIENASVQASRMAQLLARIDDGTISGKIGKQVFDDMWSSDASADDVIEKKGLKQITDTSAIEGMIDEVIAANPSQVKEYQGGKEKLLSFFVGAVMKASKGKANPAQLNQILRDKLKNA